MITDILANIRLYKDIPSEAIDFLTSEGVSCGKHIISDKVYINVEEYTTKIISDAKFESHKDYIDVQIVLNGSEKLYYTDIDNLSVDTPYSKERDIMFYADNVMGADKVILDGSNFIILYPQDAHAPQVAYNNVPGKVKKAVIKIKI